MKYLFVVLCMTIGTSLSLAQTEISFNETVPQPVPVITFEKQTLDLGDVKRGETRDLVYEFTNTGTDFLEIELVTSCNCAEIDWPLGPVAPGAKSQIKVRYDSTNQDLGQIKKTLDIICNTDPIVVEAFFHVNVIE